MGQIKEQPFFILRLPWPYKELNPNNTVHWRTKHTYKKQAKSDAYQFCQVQRPKIQHLYGYNLISVRVFYPPDNIRRDADNFGASMKSYQDGVFWFLQDRQESDNGLVAMVDDSRVKTVLNFMGQTTEKGEVIYMLFVDNHSFWIDRIHKIRLMIDAEPLQ